MIKGENMSNVNWATQQISSRAQQEALAMSADISAAFSDGPEAPLDTELGELGAALMELRGNVVRLTARLSRVLDAERQLPGEAEKAPPAPRGALCETLRDKTEQAKQINRELSRILGQLVL